jgi:hypothetical protein
MHNTDAAEAMLSGGHRSLAVASGQQFLQSSQRRVKMCQAMLSFDGGEGGKQVDRVDRVDTANRETAYTEYTGWIG